MPVKVKILFVLFALLSPGLWQVASHSREALAEWSALPRYVAANIRSKSRSPYFSYTDELRWGGRFLHRNDLLYRLVYNKSAFVANEVFDYLQFAAPKLYFAAGDGSPFSPARIEPVSSLLFPFWLLGLAVLVRNRRWRPFILLFFLTSISFLAGVKHLGLLWPVLLMHIYISAIGLSGLRRPYFAPVAGIITLYSLYITAMNLWFNSLPA